MIATPTAGAGRRSAPLCAAVWLAALVTPAALLSSGVGCGGPPQAEVVGEVTMDGTPLAEGEIIFEAVDGQTAPVSAPIAAGKYTLRVAPGKKIVRVNSSRPTRVPDPVMGAAARENAVAEEFNARSRLNAEVSVGKQENVDFAVKSAP